jgi:NOL1/NOP2/sun family putative RNA methylase
MTLPKLYLTRMASLLNVEQFALFLKTYDAPPTDSFRLARSINHPFFNAFNDTIPWCKLGRYLLPNQLNGHHPFHHAGAIYFQEPSAMAVVEMMDIQPNDFVLDIAAAPGGKTTQIAGYLSKSGLLIANDIDSKRAQTLMFNVERLGLTQVVVTNHDPQHLPKILSPMFDQILIDAPCSGEGMFRKDPEATKEWSLEHVKTCQHRQKNLLFSATSLLKKGGKITYSTCTFSPEENELLIKDFLLENPEFTLVNHPLFSLFDQTSTQGVGVKLFPHLIRGEGHYVAVLKHTGFAPESIRFQHRMRNPIPLAWKVFAEETLTNKNNVPNFMLEDRLFQIPLSYMYHAALHTLRAGVFLGDIQKKFFYPSHHLAHVLSLEDVKRSVNFSLGDAKLYQYLRGEEITYPIENGWVLIAVEGLSLGWAKASQGKLKNHYPKGIRLL